MAQNETLVPTAQTTPISMKVNVLPRDIYEELSAQERIAPQELWFVTSADSVVVDIDKINQGGGQTSTPYLFAGDISANTTLVNIQSTNNNFPTTNTDATYSYLNFSDLSGNVVAAFKPFLDGFQITLPGTRPLLLAANVNAQQLMECGARVMSQGNITRSDGTSPQDGDVLTYDSTLNKWIAKPVS